MDVSSIAAAASANSASQLREQVSVAVLKKALDIQEQGAMQLLEALHSRLRARSVAWAA